MSLAKPNMDRILKMKLFLSDWWDQWYSMKIRTGFVQVQVLITLLVSSSGIFFSGIYFPSGLSSKWYAKNWNESRLIFFFVYVCVCLWYEDHIGLITKIGGGKKVWFHFYHDDHENDYQILTFWFSLIDFTFTIHNSQFTIQSFDRND